MPALNMAWMASQLGEHSVNHSLHFQKQIENTLLELGYSDFSINLRKENDDYFVTDEKHFILDLSLKKITDPYILNKKIKKVVGVVETGLFINMANSVIIGNNGGSFKLIERKG